MTDTTSILFFLGSVIAISLTGVMMPGPVTAVTVTKGSNSKGAGALIAVGHGLIELPVIMLIYFGLASFLELNSVRAGVGLAGGLVLIWMAVRMLRNMPSVFDEHRETTHGSIVAGLATTAANPYFFVWWATVGAALLASAREFGGAGVAAMGVTHWLCDLGWLSLVSWAVFKSKPLWTQKLNRLVFGLCSVVLAGFGVWFIYSGIDLAVFS